MLGEVVLCCVMLGYVRLVYGMFGECRLGYVSLRDFILCYDR